MDLESLQNLQKQHDEIEAMAARFRQAIADDNVPQRLGTLRWQFARLLMAHLALEDRIFYPNMQRQRHEKLRSTAARLGKSNGSHRQRLCRLYGTMER